MKSRRVALRRGAGARRQHGMVMFVALGVLILMTLAGLAMLRQMGGGVSIAGNMAFKQSATAVADLGTETARAWVMASTTNRTNTQASLGYYSSWAGSVDPTTFAWATAPSTTDAATGNVVRYVIHRLCVLPDVDANAPGQSCSSEGLRAPSRGGGGGPTWTTISQPYYRITTQVTGPRNTVSYTQVVTN